MSIAQPPTHGIIENTLIAPNGFAAVQPPVFHSPVVWRNAGFQTVDEFPCGIDGSRANGGDDMRNVLDVPSGRIDQQILRVSWLSTAGNVLWQI